MRRLWVAALCAAGALAAGQASAASIVTVDFTVTMHGWEGDRPVLTAFGITPDEILDDRPLSPFDFSVAPAEVFSGSFSYDLDLVHQDVNVGADADALLTSFSFTVGTVSYSLGDIGPPGGDLFLDAGGAPTLWSFQLQKAGDARVVSLGFSVKDGFGFDLEDLVDNGLNLSGLDAGAQSVTLPVASGAPEPTVWALMIAGFGMAGGALRRRRAALA
jgi:hypothetical protein